MRVPGARMLLTRLSYGRTPEEACEGERTPEGGLERGGAARRRVGGARRKDARRGCGTPELAGPRSAALAEAADQRGGEERGKARAQGVREEDEERVEEIRPEGR